MPVITAIELDDFIALRESPCQPDGAHARLRAGTGHAYLLYARHRFANQLRHLHFERIGNAKTCAMFGGGFYGGDYFGMRMAQNGWSPGEDIINQFIAVHVPDFA